jgi:hypothetical protein
MNHLLKPFTELSDLSADVFDEGFRLPTAWDHDDESCAPSKVNCRIYSAPDGVDSEGFWAESEAIAAEIGCRRSDRSYHLMP